MVKMDSFSRGYDTPVLCRVRSRSVDVPCTVQKTVTNPASGYRNNNSASVNNVWNNGYYWSAVPNSNNNGYNLNFNSSNVNPTNNNNRSNGFSVRPVASSQHSLYQHPAGLFL